MLAATRPLLRQIETLQAAQAEQQEQWERAEASLVAQLDEVTAKVPRMAVSLDICVLITHAYHFGSICPAACAQCGLVQEDVPLDI